MAKSKKKNENENIFKTAIVEKRNILNELHKNNMSLQELRFFSIYLSKINPRDTSTRVVKFPLEAFRKIMELGKDMNINHFRLVIRHLLQQIVEVPNESGYGYTAFQLFKECTLDKDEYDEWYVTIDAHDKALPLMFDFKNRYFTYELWNALQLKSTNQIRMYEILKQYENLGKREISVAELRELLGIASTEYSRWERFKVRILDSCQQALAENTDITYTYEKGKSGKGGKWLTVVFNIKKNNKHIDQLSLSEFIKQQPEPKSLTEETVAYADICKNEFTSEQLELLVKLMQFVDERQRLSYFQNKIILLDYQSKKLNKNGKIISDRFAYLKKMIEGDYEKSLNKTTEKKNGYDSTYDIEEYESHSVLDEE